MDGVDVVVHAVAVKQVPTCEYNPVEAILTNVLGTRNVVEAALDTGVGKVQAMSTDKAVHPVNMYGATKPCAEKLVVQSNSYSGKKGTKLSCIRYGNVVGSRGSVVPLFPGTATYWESHGNGPSHDSLLAHFGTRSQVCDPVH